MIVAVVQARISSTRFPGKVMKKISNKPLIGYLLERLRYSKRIDKIIIATSIDKKNDSMCDYLKTNGFDVFRGSEEDVLGRFYYATKIYKPEGIMRITADCPLIDPEICDKVIELYLEEKADHVYLAPSFAEGLDCEIFSFSALKVAYNNAKTKSEREHVSLYFKNNPKSFKRITVENKTDDKRYRFTVDNPEDFEVVKAIINSLYRKGTPPFKAWEIKQFLDKHPEIFRKNAHITRNEGLIKSLRNDEEMAP